MLMALAVLLAAACSQEEAEEQVPLDASSSVPPAVQAQLDSGTMSFRGGDVEGARLHYRAAAELAPELPAAWFGVYLAETRLGNQAAADSAAEIVNRLAPELLESGAMMGAGHPGTAGEVSPHPPMR